MDESEQTLKVAVICDSFPKLSESFITQHVVGLIEAGHDVQIFALARSKEIRAHPLVQKYNLREKTLFAPRVPINRVNKYAKGIVLFFSLLRRRWRLTLKSINIFLHGRIAANLRLLYLTEVFKGQHYDIVHAHFGPVGLIVTKLLEIGAIHGRLVVSFHGYDLNRIQLVSSKHDFYQPLFLRAERLLVNSPFSHNRIMALGAPEKKVVILHIPVDTRVFRMCASIKKRDRNTVSLLSVGRLSEEKGHIYSLIAVNQYIHKYGAGICYRIIGGGPLESKLKDYIDKHQLGPIVELLLDQTQDVIIDEMSQSDVFLFPSIQLSSGEVDTQGLVVQEAQAMGLPVIASDVGGVRYGMIDGQTGYLVGQKDISALVSNIRKLALDNKRREEMGRAGREFVVRNYDSEVINESLIKIYYSITIKSSKSVL